jgi:hypothetical protein
MPLYRLNYGKNDCDFIHLEGEFEFRADLPGARIHELLRDRAEIIGGLVTGLRRASDGGRRHFDVYPWNGPGFFRCSYPEPGEPIDIIIVFDGDGTVDEKYIVEQMKTDAERVQPAIDYLEKNMKPADESSDPEHGKRYRLDFSKGELVPVDEEDDV